MALSMTDFDILMSGQTEYLTVFVKEPKSDELTDVVGTSTFSLINIADDTVVYTTTFGASGSSTIDHPSPGVYRFNFDTTAYSAEYLASFRCLLPAEVVNYNIFVKSEPARLFARASELRAMVDKAWKSISDDLANMDKATYEPHQSLLFGFQDKNLIYFLERGAQMVNWVPPYTNFSPVNFPWNQYGMIMYDAAVIAALEAQGIFAIDTDYNYQLGGNSLVIDHFGKISTLLSTLLTRFDANLIKFKQQFRSKGLISFQFMPGGMRSSRTLASLPSGYWSRLFSQSFV